MKVGLIHREISIAKNPGDPLPARSTRLLSMPPSTPPTTPNPTSLLAPRSPCFLSNKILQRTELPIQALARVKFGEHLLSVLGLKNTVKLQLVKNLPAAHLDTRSVIGGPDKTNANAFRNSYMWDPSNGTLYVHGTSMVNPASMGNIV